jgi:hypothetical protein
MHLLCAGPWGIRNLVDDLLNIAASQAIVDEYHLVSIP